jgi:SNF2 family DNA or RNA helicase
VIERGCRVLLVHPKAVQTGLNNLTAFHTAIWYEGPDFDARVTRQANGRPHRIGQTQPVRLVYPYYAGTLQKAALDLVARKLTASLQVDGLTHPGAREAARALSEEDRVHASAALAIGQALYRAASGAC